MAILVEQDFVFRGTYGIKEKFVAVLQAIFKNPSIVKDGNYRYSSTEADSKIRIYPSFPQRLEFWPSIIIRVAPFDASIRNVGNEREELGEKIVNGVLTNQIYGGNLVIPVICSTYAETTKDRDVIRDYLITIFRVLSRGSFSPFGIGFSHFDSSGDFMEYDQNTKAIYRDDITVQVNTDYTFLEPIGSDKLFKSVVWNVLGRLSENSPSVPLHKEPPLPV